MIKQTNNAILIDSIYPTSVCGIPSGRQKSYQHYSNYHQIVLLLIETICCNYYVIYEMHTTFSLSASWHKVPIIVNQAMCAQQRVA